MANTECALARKFINQHLSLGLLRSPRVCEADANVMRRLWLQFSIFNSFRARDEHTTRPQAPPCPVLLCLALLGMLSAFPTYATPWDEITLSKCSATRVENANAKCAGSYGRAAAGSTLKYMATARAGSTEYSQKSNAVGVVKVSNNVGTVLVNKSFTGSISQRYSRAINSAGRFSIDVSVTNRNSLRYSSVTGELIAFTPAN